MADSRQTAASLAKELRTALGEELRSVLLFGSVARGEAVAGVSDINVMVLVDTIGFSLLRSLAPLARRWAEAGNTPPLLMTWDEWRRAADVFSIELADMRDAHEVLDGENPVSGLEVEPLALRLQAERELRGKLVQLREGFLFAGERPDEVGRLLLAALPSFTTYLRAALRLGGESVPGSSEAVITDGAVLVGGDPASYLHVWRARTRKEPLRPKLEDPLVTGFYGLAERTATFVDTLPEAKRQ